MFKPLWFNEAVSKAYFITSGLFFKWGKNVATFLKPFEFTNDNWIFKLPRLRCYIRFQMINMYLKTKKTSLRWSLMEELLMVASDSYLTRNFNLKKLTLRKCFPSFGNLKPHLHYENYSMSSMLLNVFILKWGWKDLVIFAAQNLKLLFPKN